MENNKEAAQAAFAVAESELMRAAQKGVVEKHNASLGRIDCWRR